MTTPAAATNPMGRCFVSYRRSRLDDVRLLVEALHDHGVPTWQDVTNLDELPLERALRATLTDSDTASSILWITPEVADSAVITGIEIPELIARAERQDAFYLIPVAAGGLDYQGAGRAGLVRTSFNDFGSWNVVKVDHDPILAGDAAGVARRALVRRLAAVHSALPDGDPLVIDIYTRGSAAVRQDAALTVDFTHRFAGRHASMSEWQEHVLPALSVIVDEAARRAPERLLHFRGLVGLPAAVALGTTVLSPRGIPAAWLQYTDDQPLTPYSLAEEPQPSGFKVTLRDDHVDATDLAVLINANNDVTAAVRATAGLPDFRGEVQADPPGRHPHLFASAGEAVDLAREVISVMREARSRYGGTGDVHLFIAGPVGLAFLLGQLLNTFGTVHTYEYGDGKYQRAVTLRPSD